jgi:hypothetical protein
MGVMSAALGSDGSDCHLGAGFEKVDWVADTKVTARYPQFCHVPGDRRQLRNSPARYMGRVKN